MLISSQRYLDNATVEAKRQARDYTVSVSPMFVIGGTPMQAVLDGHHSLAAAILDDADPDFVIATQQINDRVALIDTSLADFLEGGRIDSDWYCVETGENVTF